MWKRVRFADKFAGVSALALLGFLFLDWFAAGLGPLSTAPGEVRAYATGWTAYGPGEFRASGWDSLGWLALALCVLAIAAGLLLPLVVASFESPVLPIFAGIAAQLLGLLAVVALIVQVIFQPGDDRHTTVLSGWWLGLIAAAGIARGGFASIRDEHSPAAKPVDVPVRPAPAA